MQISPSAELGTTQICDLIVPSDSARLNRDSACFDRLVSRHEADPIVGLLLLLFIYSQQPSHVVPLSFPSKRVRVHVRPC